MHKRRGRFFCNVTKKVVIKGILNKSYEDICFFGDKIYPYPSQAYNSGGKIYEFDNYQEGKRTNILQNVDPLVTEIKSSTDGLQANLIEGDYSWFSFYSSEKGSYSFEVESTASNVEITIEIFSHVVRGYSYEGLLDTQTANASNNGRITTVSVVNLEAYERIYLRVHGKLKNDGVFTSTSTYKLFYYEGDILYHEHIHKLGNVYIMGPDGWYKQCLECGELVKVDMQGTRRCAMLMDKPYIILTKEEFNWYVTHKQII